MEEQTKSLAIHLSGGLPYSSDNLAKVDQDLNFDSSSEDFSDDDDNVIDLTNTNGQGELPKLETG